MTKRHTIPDFATAEAADRWYDSPEGRRAMNDAAAAAFANGTARPRAEVAAERRAAARGEGPTPTVTLRLDPADVAKARRQAEHRGLRYQTYIKMLLHEALEAHD
jgi:hypothetical protein